MLQELVEEALQHLQQLVEQQPSNYEALAQLLMLLRRAGKADRGETHLQAARQKAAHAAGAAGKCMCCPTNCYKLWCVESERLQ